MSPSDAMKDVAKGGTALALVLVPLEFNLAPRDLSQFESLLGQPDPRTGYAAFTNSHGVTWLFLCDGNSGRCKYALP